MLGALNKITHIAETKRMMENHNSSPVSSADPDDWYWQAIEKYKDDPKLYEYLSTNPYLRGNNDPFSPNLLQTILSHFGDTSAEDSYYAALRTQANDFLKEATKGQYEQWYESPIEQVKRERAAGINSDLAPQSISPGEAAENDQPFSPLSMPGAGDTSFMHNMASFGLQFVSSILSFGKQIQELNLGAQQKISNELGLNNKAFDFVLNQLSGLNPSKFASAEDFISEVRNLDLSSFSKGTRKYIKHYLDSYSDEDSLAMAERVSDLQRRVLQNREQSAGIMSSPYYSDDLNTWTQNIMENFSQYVAAANSYNAIISASQAEVGATFYGDENNQNALGVNMAEELNASTESAKSASEAAKFKLEMDKTWNQLEKAVKGDGKHWYNTIGMILIQFLRAQVNNPINFSAGFNAGLNRVNSNSNSNVISHSTSNSHSENVNYNYSGKL